MFIPIEGLMGWNPKSFLKIFENSWKFLKILENIWKFLKNFKILNIHWKNSKLFENALKTLRIESWYQSRIFNNGSNLKFSRLDKVWVLRNFIFNSRFEHQNLLRVFQGSILKRLTFLRQGQSFNGFGHPSCQKNAPKHVDFVNTKRFVFNLNRWNTCKIGCKQDQAPRVWSRLATFQWKLWFSQNFMIFGNDSQLVSKLTLIENFQG